MALLSNLRSFCLESAVTKKMIRWLSFQVLLHGLFVMAVACFTFSSFKGRKAWVPAVMNEGTGFLLLLVIVTLMILVNLLMLYKEHQKLHASSRRKFLLAFWVVILSITFVILAMILFQLYGFRLSSTMDIRDLIPTFQQDIGALITPLWQDYKHLTLFISVGPLSTDPLSFGLHQWIGLKVDGRKVYPLYSLETFAGTCRTKDQRFCLGSDGHPSCSIQTELHNPSSQICRSDSGEEGPTFCQLRPYPQTLLGYFERDWEAIYVRRIHSRISMYGSLICNDSCRFKADGACDDGGFRAQYHVCEFGSDCEDCNTRSLYYETMKTKFYPTCGWIPRDVQARAGNTIVRAHDIPNLNEFPQRYYTQWLEGKWFTNNTKPLGRFGNERECMRACLLENFMAQELCKLIQFNRKSGKCEQIVGFSEWCTWSGRHMECPFLRFTLPNGQVTKIPPKPYDALTAQMRGNNWERVETLPTRDLIRDVTHSGVFVIAEQVYSGKFPEELESNRDMRVALMPFYAFPGILGVLFLYELCYKVPSAENPIRFTDSELPFNWYLFMQSAFCSQLSRASNLKMLLLGYTVAVWTSLILPRLVTAGARISRSAWAVSLLPIYLCAFVIVLGTFGLLRMVCSEAHSVLFTVDDRVYQYRTLALFLCLFIPCTICLCLWNYFVEEDTDQSFELYLLPFLIGFVFHAMLLLIYTVYFIRSTIQRYKDGNLEQVEVEARAKLRQETACKVNELKAEFYNVNTSSERLVEIIQILTFHQNMLVTRQELLELGTAKLAILESADDKDMVRKCWTKDVAKAYGQALMHLTSASGMTSGQFGSPTSMRRVKFADLHISGLEAPYMVALRRKKLGHMVEEYLRDTTSICLEEVPQKRESP